LLVEVLPAVVVVLVLFAFVQLEEQELVFVHSAELVPPFVLFAVVV
jgi:hypothetical protein